MIAAPENDEQRENVGVTRRQKFWLWFGRVMWGANLTLLVGAFAWILWDPIFPHAATALAKLNILRWPSLVYNPSKLGLRLDCLKPLVIASVLTTAGVFVTLFVGAHSHRNLRSWFAFSLIIAAWLTLFVAWPEVAWQGQRLRLWTRLDGFQAAATALQNNWPKGDGEIPGVGTFMAYPQGKPRTLMILVEPQPPTKARFSAVERSNDGTLRFELAGDETGSWLELHPSGSAPESFTGGLENTYTRRRSAPLGNGWYLVRYR